MGRVPPKLSGDVIGPHADTEGVHDQGFAAQLRGYGPFGVGAILFIIFSGNIILPNMMVVPAGALLTLAWVHFSHTPWREIGYIRPGNWMGTLGGGLIVGIALKLFVKTILMPVLGADPINATYHFLAGNDSLLPMATISMFVAGIAEETVFRGFLFERLGKIFGSSNSARVSMVLLTSVLFSLGHLNDQRIAGMEQAIFTGLTFGTIYAVTGRLFFVMMAHTAYDLAALFMIYSGTEADFAHLIFK